MAVPLTNLIRKECPEVVVWTEEYNKAFNSLKNVPTSTPVLSNPDFERTFIPQECLDIKLAVKAFQMYLFG